MNKAEASPQSGDPGPEATAAGISPASGADRLPAAGPSRREADPAPDLPVRPPARTREAISRVSRTWVALAVGLVLTVAVLVFILQNLRSVPVHFFTATWDIPFGVDLLLATVLGGGIVFAAGSVRILQLRRSARPAGRGRWTRTGGRAHRSAADGPEAG